MPARLILRACQIEARIGRRTSWRVFRLARRLVLPVIFVWGGFIWGHLSRTIDIYRQSGAGDDVNLPRQGPLFLENTATRTPIHEVGVSGNALRFDREATRVLLEFPAGTGFPDRAWIEADNGTKTGRRLFVIPIFGMQNPIAEDKFVTPWSNSRSRVAEPPSDPYRVLARFCRSLSKK